MTNEQFNLAYKLITSRDEEMFNLGRVIFIKDGTFEDLVKVVTKYTYSKNIIVYGMSFRLKSIEDELNSRDAKKWREYEKRYGKNLSNVK